MTNRLLLLANRIRNELVELERLLRRVEKGWNYAAHSTDDHYLDSVALNLHGFYSGLERIFELIATVVDGTKPQGENWHQELLKQMAGEVLEMRPAVISDSSVSCLNDYRGFRHIVRNVYTFKFDPVKIEKLVKDLREVFSQVRGELLAFADFLQSEE